MFKVNDFTFDTTKFPEYKIVYKPKGLIRPVEGKRFFSIASVSGQRIIAERVPNIESLRAKSQPYYEVNGFKYDPTKFAEFKLNYRDGRIKYHSNKRYVSLETRTAQRLINKYVGDKNLLKWVPPKKEEKEFMFHQDTKTGFLTHFINSPELSTNEIDPIMGRISPVVADAKRRMGITDNGMLHARFIYSARMDGREIRYFTKSFRGMRVGDSIDKFRENYQKYIDLNLTSDDPNHDYTREIDKIVLTFIPENRGGCNNGKHDKKIHIKDAIHIAKRTGEMKNNCLFKSLIDYCDFAVRFKTKRGNEIRAEYGLPADSQIPISIALQIFEKYKKEEYKDYSLQINDTDTMTIHESDKNLEAKVYLSLADNHYTIVQLKEYKKCDKCLRRYQNNHKCNPKREGFVNAKFKKTHRYLLTKTNYEKEMINEQVLHYDIETYQKVLATGETIHTCYIVGYTDPLDNHKFKYFAGDDCMSRFCDEMLRIGKVFGMKTLYVNAFNGANFDHYFIYKEYLKRNINSDNARQNGSIISCKYENIRFFDVCKHLQGGLSSNLKAFKCDVQKGDFNHDLASRWEDMKENLREDCLLYLRSDVMGLKELFDKLNTTIFNEHKVNITSYISTSSLSFNLWKRTIDKKYDIRLPTIEQEEAFRESVRGGRCYKSKSEFVSKQYNEYKNRQTTYEDIDDYIIDADVVSLYPSAMAQFEYPTGECLKLDSGKKEMKGKMGIYKIKYITNKRLAHAILGRRCEKEKKLIWDLTDGEGWYSSVEIEDAIANGYQVEILDGYYWTQTGFVFKEYIEELFKKKEELSKQGKKGSVEYLLSKLFMNALYGKQIQRPIYNKTVNITSVSEYWKFWSRYIINDITKIQEGLYEVSGIPREKEATEKRITKPTQLGSFILAYSRRIMLGYIKEANPYFDHKDTYQKEQIDNDIHYTDTDSLQMKAGCAKRMKNLGKKSLGMITDDLGDGCKIIKGLWISPKLYMLEYAKKGDTKTHFHFRGKGLSADKLSPELYEQMAEGKSYTNTRDFQMKKIHAKRNSNQQNIPMFSVQHFTNIQKTVNSSRWAGRQFDNNYNYSVPWGSSNTLFPMETIV